IEEDTDLNVKLEPGLGKTAFVFSGLKDGDIDIFPEFTGTAIVTHLDQKAESNDAQEVYDQAKKGMQDQYDMAFLQPMQYNNTYSVAVTETFAREHHLDTIGDLKKVEDEITAGFTLEFKDRYDGY